jgi:hypothetical protein
MLLQAQPRVAVLSNTQKSAPSTLSHAFSVEDYMLSLLRLCSVATPLLQAPSP